MDGLKQRIIGALVLISLVVIFVPMLFDEPHSERTSRAITLPEEPPFPEVHVPQPKPADIPSYRLEEPADTAAPPARQAPPSEPLPELAEPAITQPAPPEAREPEPPVASTPEPRPEPRPEPAARVPAETASADFTRSLKGAWVIQLGSFGNAENARRLRDRVREKGYHSHLQEVPRGDSSLTRVFSGPFADKSEAERAKKALDAAFGLNSLVTSND
ncbi:SPOR domain-containing protein [Marinobacter sp. X15-166B]|uniref:SPOR domain-containing protein n=1 Tax=Marinobacter sp. X15-166B TaxID=1897620 RepID=UPI00085BD1D0|nr:sporulation protein [Marinobacter sp. X15-166B]